jgi:hypothetical protein
MVAILVALATTTGLAALSMMSQQTALAQTRGFGGGCGTGGGSLDTCSGDIGGLGFGGGFVCGDKECIGGAGGGGSGLCGTSGGGAGGGSGVGGGGKGSTPCPQQ